MSSYLCRDQDIVICGSTIRAFVFVCLCADLLHFLYTTQDTALYNSLTCCLCVFLSEAQPVYIGVPVSHRRKRRRHRSSASDADRDTRHAHYDHHTHCEHSHRGYYHDREEHCDDEEDSTEHHEHADPAG